MLRFIYDDDEDHLVDFDLGVGLALLLPHCGHRILDSTFLHKL